MILPKKCSTVEKFSNESELKQIQRKFNERLQLLKLNRPTAKLWIQYFEMVQLVKTLLMQNASVTRLCI